MAARGQRFELDLEADDFAIKPVDEDDAPTSGIENIVKEVQEHEPTEIPSAPKPKQTRSGFPEHRPRKNVSAFKQSQQFGGSALRSKLLSQREPSDRAIMHQVGKKHGVDLEAQQKAEISEENKQKLEQMSTEDIEQARRELMRSLNPAFIERLLKRANIDEDQQDDDIRRNMEAKLTEDVDDQHSNSVPQVRFEENTPNAESTTSREPSSSIHFPVPPRSVDDFVPLDPDSSTFLEDLKTHYFPDTPHDPSSLSWLQDPSVEENEQSPYNPEKYSYTTSSLRFNFQGRLIAPKESLDIDVSEGLHHHGDAPSSAGYTIPELAILARSALPNQRSIAYQTTGRILFRLGRGDFGERGTELQEALWNVIERERIIEIMMSEANRASGHISAKTYATEALWLWRKGGGGDRGVLKPTEKIAK